MIEGSGSRAATGSISLTNGSGSGRPKKHVDPMDPEYCLKLRYAAPLGSYAATFTDLCCTQTNLRCTFTPPRT